MVRGSGKFKTRRGGGRSFSRHLELDENGTAVSVDRRRRGQQDDDDGDEDEDEDEDDEEENGGDEIDDGDDDGEGVVPTTSQPEITRQERKELKRKQAQEKVRAKQPASTLEEEEEEEDDEDEDEMLVNPNRIVKKMNISDLNEPRQLSRREREAKEKKEAQEKYWKLHVQGKTDQAKSDLARLAKIRQEREAAQAQRKAEAEGVGEIRCPKMKAWTGEQSG
ncbi:casein kinase substrate phosphoprotein PP28-domain-containing protein [Vararia minispora EC-137]|uniref:Casein kinase substrate phosphoprotein PP28-domain-containing protein n=1 Tax=Vararia minispora EC-137 TaxID=1314806 RepID=A0ACB8QB10_9AGAM|nr:casein kinase substrate phosphoprotein PP28-domain-containing protein [Vararia minispora EC-137]